MTRIAFPLIVAALMASAVPAIADGLYRGSFQDKGRSVPVILTLQSSDLGEDAGQIRFREPWACGFKLEFSGTTGQTSTYSFKGAGAGPCTSLTLGYLRSQPDGGDLQVELFDQKNTSRQKVVLAPATN